MFRVERMQTKKTPTKSQLTPPQGVRNACKTGIKLFEDGLGGSGLEPATIREARAIVRGTPITIAKAKKMVRWWGRNARFLTYDKDSPAWVAAMLWGGRAGLSWSRKLKRTFDAKDDKASQGSISSGDFVSWTTSKGGYVGKVESIRTSGKISVATSEGGSETIEASSENQVAIVRVYVNNQDGSYTRSDRTVPVKVSMLRSRGEPNMKASASQKKTLKEKADEHNEKVGNAKTKRTNVRTLSAVFDRGLAAYTGNPSSVRPTVNSASQWAFARVNSFLYVLRNGRFRGGKHDQDLLPSGHPQSSKKEAIPSRTMTSDTPTMSMENAIIIEDQSKFDAIDLKERPVEIHMKVTSPFVMEKKDADDTSTDVKIRGPVYVGSDEMLDRHDELVTTEAIMSAWKNYSKNPVILYNHSKTYGVIGTMKEVKLGEFNGVKVPIGTAVIDGGEKDITRKINKGFLKAFSIGFIAKAAVKECKEDDSCYMKFTEIDWVETSIVDVPASPNALFSVQKSFVWGTTSSVETNNATGSCGCGEGLCGSAETEKHILAVEEDDETYTIVFEKLPEGEMDEMGYYDDEDDKKSIENRITDMENAISNLTDVILGKEKNSDSLNNHISEGVRLMDNADTPQDEDLEVKSVEEELVSETIETPVLVEEKEMEITESEDLPVEEKELEVPMPSPKEALLDIASSLKAITEKLFAEEVVEEAETEDELTLVKAELAQLKADIAEKEAKEAMESEIEARVQEALAEKGVETPVVPSRKSITKTNEIDPVETKAKGEFNGLGNWLEANLKQARRY